MVAPIYKIVDINDIQVNDWNPNVEDATTFNDLVDNIKENGFAQPLEVAEVEGAYRIVDGEHRWKAAKLAGLTELPVMIVDWDEDTQMMQTVAMNVLR